MSDSPTEKKVAEKKESLRLPSLEDVREWEGYRVDEVSGHSVARVEGFFVDQESGEPSWVLLKLGRFGKVVPVSIRECAGAEPGVCRRGGPGMGAPGPRRHPGRARNRSRDAAQQGAGAPRARLLRNPRGHREGSRDRRSQRGFRHVTGTRCLNGKPGLVTGFVNMVDTHETSPKHQ